MTRNLFGGTAADVAEDIDGRRIPGAVGTVWNGPSDGATQITDLTDADGAPIIQLVADHRGFIPSFYGPGTGAERLWVDFGVGRMGLVSTTAGERLQEHITAPDPHQSRAYTDERAEQLLPRAGGVVDSPSSGTWLLVQVPEEADDEGAVLALSSASGSRTRISNRGSVYVDAPGSAVALAIGAAGRTASDPVVNISSSSATSSTAQSVFRIMGDGSLSSAGTIHAGNIGSARVFSGPTPPSDPQAGDVWVEYG